MENSNINKNINKNLNLVFFGTSNFAIPILEDLIKHHYSPTLIVTQPDKPFGRKKITTPPPIKSWAINFNLKITQAPNLSNNQEFLQQFKELNPDICIVAAYGKIIPQEYLKIPRFGFLNIHPSILPKYRGPTPIQTAILNGDKESGVTIILMDEKMDHGPIIKSKKANISNLNYKEAEEKLAKLGSELLIEVLPKWIRGEIKSKEQNHSKATFTKKFTWQDGKINWENWSQQIDLQIKALNPEPGTWSFIKFKKRGSEDEFHQKRIIKILSGEVFKSKRANNPKIGEVILLENKSVAIKCGKDFLKPKIVQLEGKKILTIKEFLNGYPNFIGSILE